MSIHTKLLAGLVVLGSVSISHAGFIIGWHDFTDDAVGAPFTDSVPDVNSAGLTSTVLVGSTVTVVTGGSGSVDGTYGNFGGPPNAPLADVNFLGINALGQVLISITNAITNPALTLSGLLFDGIKSGPTSGSALSGSWSINGGAATNIGAPFLFSPSLNSWSSGGTFNSYGFGMSAVVAPGDTITFNFTTNGSSAVGMDNIGLLGDFAVVAVPEPTGVIGLGALVTLGFCGRRRSVRRAVAAVA